MGISDEELSTLRRNRYSSREDGMDDREKLVEELKEASKPKPRPGKPMEVDYRFKVSMPIRDLEREGRVYCVVDVYGVTTRDLAMVPGGSAPMHRAVERLGLDPRRYQAIIWDIPT
jgi:hypothetical protein